MIPPIFLNISKDHISPTEHKDFDDYFQSKLKIFDRCTCACVNLDSDHIGEILKLRQNVSASLRLDRKKML